MKQGPKVLIGSVTPYTLRTATTIVHVILRRHSNATKSRFNSLDERVRYGDHAWSAHEKTDASSAMTNSGSTLIEFTDG
jgi:hypothetical protein